MEETKGPIEQPELREVIMDELTPQAMDLANVKDSKDSDAASNASDASDDSMEPFSEYLPKIERLLTEIGLEGFSVEPLQHGHSHLNCVYALKSPIDENERYVLRVPNCPDFEDNKDDGRCLVIPNDAACLGYLADKLPVPRVKGYCATTENALNAPYAVQTMVQGQSMDNVYDDLSHADKYAVIDQYVDLLAKLESITFSRAGHFAAATGVPDTTHDFLTPAAPLIEMFDGGPEDFVQEPQTLLDRAGPDVKALLLSHVKGFIKDEQDDEALTGGLRVDVLQPMALMLEDMEREGCFEDGPYPVVLHHWDLEPRNVMVENSTGTWKICGVIDWDDSQCVPRPLARRPPEWIWDAKGATFTGALNNDFDTTVELPEDAKTLKAYFDTKAEEALPGYLEDAYGRGRWLRQIWLLARDLMSSTFLLDRAIHMRKLWDLRATYTEPGSLIPTKPEPVLPIVWKFMLPSENESDNEETKSQHDNAEDSQPEKGEETPPTKSLPSLPEELQSIDLADTQPPKTDAQPIQPPSNTTADTPSAKPKGLWKKSIDWFTHRVQSLRT